MRRRGFILSGLFTFLLFAGGCATTREITIHARPADAMIAIDGQNQGAGPLTHKFIFHGDQDQHSVVASRIGFKDLAVTLTRSTTESDLQLDLRPQSKRVTFIASPVPAVIRVDGKSLSEAPVTQASIELEFTADAQGHWTHHTVSAERADWDKVEKTLNWADASPQYLLELGTLKKDVTIATEPPGARVTLNGAAVGTSPVKLKDVPFAVDPATERFLPQRVTISKPGYDLVVANLNWDDGRAEYVVNIPPRSKEVRIVTNPPGGMVMIDGKPLGRNGAGISTAKLAFVPTDEIGTLPQFKAVVSKKTADTEWYPADLSIAWDNGRADYAVTLREIRTTPVSLISPRAVRGDDGWKIEAQKQSVLAMKDVTEPSDREQPTRITELAKDAIIDSLSISPDGSQLLFTTLSNSSSAGLRSQIQLLKTDGSGGATVFSEETALSLTPSFTPDGSQILFASNRAGRRLSVWQMSAVGEAGITQLTGGEENVLWPIVDSEPKPRLFYTAMLDSLPNPRLYMTRMGTTTRTDLARAGGMQPRINPRGDRIVYCNFSEKNGNRQIYLIPDRGGPPAAIGDPDADEYDAIWSRDGRMIAFASNRGKDDEVGSNYDIWVIDLNHPDHPIQVTQNGSWDDRPAWDPSGKSLYFRSNRGGQWAVWKVTVPTTAATEQSKAAR